MSVQIESVNGVMRSVYRQVDGEIIFADECKCDVRTFPRTLSLECPIDEHRIQALAAEAEET